MGITQFALFISVLIFMSCNSSIDKKEPQITSTPLSDTTINVAPRNNRFSVVILPTYDKIANAGISPNIAGSIDYTFSSDSTFKIMTLPCKEVADCYMIYDKRYCQEVVDKKHPDIIIMSKLVQLSRTGNMYNDKWNIEVKAYLPQIDTIFTIYSAKNINDWAYIEKDIFVKLGKERVKAIIQLKE